MTGRPTLPPNTTSAEDRELVDCDESCGAPAEPQTYEEYVAAYHHWRHHGMWGGCSHANI